MLRSRFFSPEQVGAIVRDYGNAGLAPADVAMLSYAEKVTLHAYKVTPQDIEALRAHGFSDAEIFDIASVEAMRSLYSKILDGVGAEPDAEYLSLEPELKRALTVGRPFGGIGEAV